MVGEEGLRHELRIIMVISITQPVQAHLAAAYQPDGGAQAGVACSLARECKADDVAGSYRIIILDP
jgi:hypothetical protein